MELRILHEESHFLIIDKPAGLFSQAAAGIDSVQTVLEEQLKQRDQHTGTPFVGLPHRLDRGTSGVMLIARNQRALKRFGEQFQSRKIGKHYLAAVAGQFAGESEEWIDHIRKIQDQPLAEVCSSADENAKLAQLTAQSLYSSSEMSLLLIKLQTGRMHQIRIQSASRGLPVVGDEAYGGPPFFDETTAGSSGNQAANPPNSQRPIGLHALRIELRHPQTAKQLAFTSSPPSNWLKLPAEMQSALETVVCRSQRDRESVW